MRLKVRFDSLAGGGTQRGVVFSDERGTVLARCEGPVSLEGWDGSQDGGTVRTVCGYQRIQEKDGWIIGTAVVEEQGLGTIRITDRYRSAENGIWLEREAAVVKSGGLKGFRLWWEMELGRRFEELRYFAPPAVFDKNDLDEDGYEDYFHTQKLIYREDRLNYPSFMAYEEDNAAGAGRGIRLERAKLPAYDSHPTRGIKADGEAESFFLQRTDIGSLGIWGGEERPARLCACYPYYEGDATIGLYIVKTVPFGAFRPLEEGESFRVSYRISASEYADFHQASWDSVARVIRERRPQAAELAVSPEELVRYRLEALNRYYVEKEDAEDPNRPAGYVLNCHPQDGKQLENIIQYGFTGQNIMNAYNVLRYGYEMDGAAGAFAEYRRRAVRVADFYADRIRIPDSGMFYNLYNIDRKKVSFWWTGLLLPLAYAEGGELEELMGPLYEYRKEVIDTLAGLKGAYLRCMNEDVTELLRIYRLELSHGRDHLNWLDAVKCYCDFLLRTQEKNGSWYRAYDCEAHPITEPQLWFGTAECEKKSSTATSIPLLVEMAKFTGESRYLDAARRAGSFVKKEIIDKVRFNGGVHDSIYEKGQLIDNESILYPMFGMLALYEETGDELFLEGAVRAAHYHASWICLWDVPLPEDSTLGRYGFHSIGMGACDTCGSGYLHPFQLLGVAQLARIAVYAKEPELLETARLYWLGCNQTVSLPGRDWGYASYGLQEEGYLVSWWAVDDPMFSGDTGFGHRLKGEGNKTCFPWINAVGVKAYWNMIDSFGSVDFAQIADKYDLK